MTNEEWLNTLSTEEKAKFIARSCNLCSYDSDNGYCSDSFNVCKNGIKEWLKREHIEPMPQLKVGDVLRFNFVGNGEVHTATVVGEGYMYSSDSGYGLAEISDSHYKIIEVWRFNGKRLKTIWRADNE